jgi:predicted enzyme related to lactoylglutathione lyase
MPRVIHFEIPADRPERAAKFYGDVFGWQFHKWDGPMEYWLVSTGEEGQPGINGGLMRRSADAPAVVNTIDVPSVDDYVAKIEQSGGKVVAPKIAIPGIGYMAYAVDPDGNSFGIMQNDPSAA